VLGRVHGMVGARRTLASARASSAPRSSANVAEALVRLHRQRAGMATRESTQSTLSRSPLEWITAHSATPGKAVEARGDPGPGYLHRHGSGSEGCLVYS